MVSNYWTVVRLHHIAPSSHLVANAGAN
jgi:hypothetical protein